MANKSVVLNFHDTLLHQSDVDLLSGENWLNDNVISFYFEYLQRIIYKKRKELLFISPEVTQCLKISPQEELGVFLDPLKFRECQFVFLALNDCELLDSPGGMHWSLLVYSRPENTFFHFDSMRGSNHNEAVKLASNLLRYASASGKGDFKEVESTQQNNGYDCGIYVLCNVDHVSEFCIKMGRANGCGMVKNLHCLEKREQMLNLIHTLGE